MLVPLNWLRELVDIIKPVEQLAETLSLAGLEAASITKTGDWWDRERILVGRVVSVKQHPNADRLVVLEVTTGGAEPHVVITSAENMRGFKDAANLPILNVGYAGPGSFLIDPSSKEKPQKKRELTAQPIRGVKSFGMVCSEDELGVGDDHAGIMILEEDAPIGTPLSDYLGSEILELELTADMGRCLSITGIAREVSALTGAVLRPVPDNWNPAGEDDAADYVAVEIAEPGACARYTGSIIRDVTVGPSPAFIQSRLRQAGQRPISNIVDIVNYVMLELGQPMHAFDYDLLVERAKRAGKSNPVITVRRSEAQEKLTTLDGVDRTLDEGCLLIADTAGPLAIAGVIGGMETAVTGSTRNILLESATFEGTDNRRTSHRLKINTESSYRFTRGVPASLNPIASRRAGELIRLHAGGRIVRGLVDLYPVKQPERVVYLTENEIKRHLGVTMSAAEVKEKLDRLGFVVEVESAERLPARGDEGRFGLRVGDDRDVIKCIAPWHRLDIKIPADVLEELARIVGYDNIEIARIGGVLPRLETNLVHKTEEQIRDILVGLGLQETISYAFTSPENHEKLNLGGGCFAPGQGEYVALANPPSALRSVMRRSTVVSALENAAYNLRFSSRLAYFEVGRVYLPKKDDIRPDEERRLTLLVTGPREIPSVHPHPDIENFDFYDLKGFVELLLQRVGVKSAHVQFDNAASGESADYVCAEVKVKGAAIGRLGEISKQVLSAFGIDGARVFVAELKIEPLVMPEWQVNLMAPISDFPEVREDLAFVVAEEVTAARLIAVVRGAAGPLLVNVELFDIYRGEPLQPGMKSMAIKLAYQSLQGTLTNEDIGPLRERIISAVTKELGGALR